MCFGVFVLYPRARREGERKRVTVVGWFGVLSGGEGWSGVAAVELRWWWWTAEREERAKRGKE